MNRRRFLKFLGVGGAATAVQIRALAQNRHPEYGKYEEIPYPNGKTSRTDLSDLILDIKPSDTPFMTLHKNKIGANN